MQEDSLRGTALARFTFTDVKDDCACGHTFGNHFQAKDKSYGTNLTAVNFRCRYCTCQDFVSVEKREESQMGMPVNKVAQQNGYDLGQKFAKVFTVKADASYQDKVALGMHFANSQGLSLENGAAFVNGFVDGLDTSGPSRARHMSLEDKIDMLLERELTNKLAAGDNESK